MYFRKIACVIIQIYSLYTERREISSELMIGNNLLNIITNFKRSRFVYG